MTLKFQRNGETLHNGDMVGWTYNDRDHGWRFYPCEAARVSGRLPVIQRRTREEVECALGVFLSIPQSSAGVRK